MLQMELWTQTSAGSLLALSRFIFSSDKRRHAPMASEPLILVPVASVASAHAHLLDVDSLGRSAGFSAWLGQEEPEDTLAGRRAPGCPPHMADMMSLSSPTPFPGVPPHNTHGRRARRRRVRRTRINQNSSPRTGGKCGNATCHRLKDKRSV